ncbi:MAG TPA: response regulator [Candidatus Methylomirabilis sp.]|nr:response regulator [Candidatus Methylomirabilis sp.]
MSPPPRPAVLVVDDSPTMRGLLRTALSAGGYDTIEAADGYEGLARLQAQPVRAILTDVNMPRMDGLSFLRQVRQEPRFARTPILVLTTEAAPEVKAAGKEAGATGWIVKPFRPEQLCQILDQVIQRAEGAGTAGGPGPAHGGGA